ncbi:MAG: DUF1553 domain-containing protein [Verrucomicrobiota bacterium]
MNPHRILHICALAMLSTGFADEPVSFNRDVRPILSDRCFACHGPDAENQKSDFRLDTREHALADLGGYAGVVPGDLKASEFHYRIHTDDEIDQMPPPDALHGLSDEEKDILDRWIEQGAPYDGHWAFQQLPAKVDVPKAGDDWASSEIDRFVSAELSRQSFSPTEAASREKWLRRVTFDLTGLPPTLDEIDAFVRDETSQAHERVVDRLLDSDAYAERMTSEWLDVARYSDTYGFQRDDERFVWPWRDWVIRAFRQNMPYDEFIKLQLAGDLLPDATRDQILATTFNRLHSHKKEGGVALEEFRIENVADRTHTVGAAFMGLTLECSRCHDHKYDPITMKDYYQLTSFFANIDERGLISYFTDAVPTPAMPLPSQEQEAELAAAKAKVREAEAALAKAEKQAADDYQPHEAELPGLVASLSFEELTEVTQEESKDEMGRDVAPEKMRKLDGSAITLVENTLVDGKHGKAMQLTGDDAVVLPGAGHFGRHQPFSVSIWLNAPDVESRAVIWRRSRGWDDAGTIGYELTKEGNKLSAKLVHFWPGNAICVETTTPLEADRWYHVVVTYDGSSAAAGLKIYVDGQPASADVVQDHLTRNITEWREGYYDFAIGSRYRDRGFKNGKVDEFRLFDRELAAIEAAHLFDGEALTKAKESDLRDWFRSAHHEPSQTARVELAETRKSQNAVRDAIPAITIMREQSEPRPAYILTRGLYDQHAEPVIADTPGFLTPFPKDAPRNRLGLAHWLTEPDHPLTARVTVNRYWQMIFGAGLVPTPEDFGNQSPPPTHPELLDWLARDFVDHGWDVQRLLRMFVLSSTYRQSAIASEELLERDPHNSWLARGPRQRLTAEMIRDNTLASSGLLVRKVGGAPVKPYDLAFGYKPLDVDEGDRLHRRSLYTFWKRTSPSPVMMTMNASKREVCRLQREVTNTPLQALVMLNGSQFTKASEALARQLLEKHDGDIDAISRESFRLLTSRQANDRELEILRALFNEQLKDYEADPALATELLGDEKPNPQTAAATVLINSIMNLDESLRHQ